MVMVRVRVQVVRGGLTEHQLPRQICMVGLGLGSGLGSGSALGSESGLGLGLGLGLV